MPKRIPTNKTDKTLHDLNKAYTGYDTNCKALLLPNILAVLKNPDKNLWENLTLGVSVPIKAI